MTLRGSEESCISRCFNNGTSKSCTVNKCYYCYYSTSCCRFYKIHQWSPLKLELTPNTKNKCILYIIIMTLQQNRTCSDAWCVSSGGYLPAGIFRWVSSGGYLPVCRSYSFLITVIANLMNLGSNSGTLRARMMYMMRYK